MDVMLTNLLWGQAEALPTSLAALRSNAQRPLLDAPTRGIPTLVFVFGNFSEATGAGQFTSLRLARN